MGDAMKLDKWPEEIECDGWRWALQYFGPGERPSDGYSGPRYLRRARLYTPPTMREIMEHLLSGGDVVEETGGCDIHYRLSDSILVAAVAPHLNTWSPAAITLGSKRLSSFRLLGLEAPNE